MILLWVYVFLVGAGAFGALAFTFDYSRTADLKQPVSRQLLILNFAVGVLLLLILVRYLLDISGNLFPYRLIVFFLLSLVDASIFYQWHIMRKVRKQQRISSGAKK